MAQTIHTWGPVSIPWFISGRACWWLRDGKLCNGQLYPMFVELAYMCDRCGNKTSEKEVAERKYGQEAKQ